MGLQANNQRQNAVNVEEDEEEEEEETGGLLLLLLLPRSALCAGSLLFRAAPPRCNQHHGQLLALANGTPGKQKKLKVCPTIHLLGLLSTDPCGRNRGHLPASPLFTYNSSNITSSRYSVICWRTEPQQCCNGQMEPVEPPDNLLCQHRTNRPAYNMAASCIAYYYMSL
ncbi:hypothetical protein EYF80_009027 [Liparis tanakae]|uniref:Uncharacterized protein n=1 Tax=Liparis tanakae TaxID=230148 RepID=A0A4Z2IUA1_9TELE|nr:hypothetical protein EYF80_009027 [Liparis tanakae]